MHEEILQNLNERLDQAIVKGREIIEDEDFKKRVTEIREQSEYVIRQHPVKSIMIGFGIGFLLAKIFSSED